MFQLSGRKAYEWFFWSELQPFVLLSVNLLFVRFTLWGPWPFASLAVGLLWQDHPWAGQLYLGLKCDGSATSDLHQGRFPELGREGYLMVLTLKELAAVRVHTLSKALEWNNQAGV